MVSQVNVAPIGVLPLKVLATREVIRERMDYKDCLGGKLREELDGLARFEGKFVIDNSGLEVLWRVGLSEIGAEGQKVQKYVCMCDACQKWGRTDGRKAEF